MSNFEVLLDKMSKERQLREEQYRNSLEYKIKDIIISFKCWCHANGKWYNLDENDFKKFVSVEKINLDFTTNKAIYEQCFGYEFEYDSSRILDGRCEWKTKKKGTAVLNAQ